MLDIIDAAISKRAHIETLTTELAELETTILSLGRGKHLSAAGAAVTVVNAVPASIGPIRYQLSDYCTARQIAGAAFPRLFDREVSHVPCKSFAEVAPKLLTPARARDLLALCEVPGIPFSAKRGYVRYAPAS